MRLTKLELNGFKSFARKTEIRFGGGVTAIIGPNGSGKSNISDAVRWVLGEQSAKALRGSKMEDVIFNGTQLRKALAYSEVTLTFDNSDGMLKVPFTEVAVTRRVYRSGESEYSINRNACRLRDIQDLFCDTGIGKDGYSIISQGKVEEILSNKSGDRRAAFEEAAGVMRYRVRKEEAERKLDHTEKNLERIEDILKELSDRLGPLEEQSASARAYLRMRDELRDLEVNLFLYQYERAQEKLAAIEAAAKQMLAERDVSEASESELVETCAALEEQLRALDASLSAQQNKLMGLVSESETRVGASRVLSERRENALSQKKRILSERESGAARLTELTEAISGMQADESGQAALSMLDREIEAAQTRVTAQDEETLRREEALEAMKNSIIERMNRMSDYRSSVSRYDTMRASIEERLGTIELEAKRRSEETARLEEEQKTAARTHAEEAEKLETAKRDLDASVENRRKTLDRFSALREELQKDEQNISSLLSRLRLLEEMQRSREGYFASVKNILRDAPNDTRLSRAIVGVVAELIRVPKEYEIAVTMAMGSTLQNIVTPTAEDAKYVIEYLRARDYGRATLLPMALLNPTRPTREERAMLDLPGCIGVASELVSCDDNVRDVIDYLLCRTIIVKDLDAGIALKKRTRGAFHIATLEGDIISTGGSMSGGSLQKQSHSLLGREREITELRETLKKADAALEEKKRALIKNEQELLQCDIQVDAFRDAVHACEIEAAKQAEQLDMIHRDVEKSRVSEAELESERLQLSENLTDVERERKSADESQTTIEQDNASTREDVIKAQAELAELRKERERVSTELSEQKVRRMALSKERDAVYAEQKRLVNEHRDLSIKLQNLEKEAAENETAIAQIDQELAGMLSEIEADQKVNGAEKEAQKKLEEERLNVSNSLSELRKRREELLTGARDLSERIHKQEMQQTKLEMELAAMQDHIWEEYQLTYENAAALRRDIAVGATNARINEIKAEVRELGDINLGSIEEYKIVAERHSTLKTQFDDLQKAKADLQQLILELTSTMETVFLRQFELIQQNFSGVFAELFGGGYAELRLTDKNDVLGCDIDIIAQPPGKKLQLLTLLSGGERALTAIALLFAMLMLKPPAFCMLDEIESALDEANVTRFADYVKRYSDGTQFILITHRKGSMEVCDSLYGVSMEEKGVSKVVSARFGDSGESTNVMQAD
ncbi:MAG TPA: chromosome segregation protein SMC [Feifaniaceae bacterium]|nr:chromosome segregation protein SMC [Feifaniaceae bacterium]